MKFALYFGNRGFFPGSLIAGAIGDFKSVLAKYGHEALVMEGLTRYDAVETPAEGAKFAAFLKEHEGEYDGLILSLPNFGDENGALAALRGVKTPILVQAYPDEPGKMDFEHRRDALCGKIAMCNVLRQAGIKFTLTEDFTVHPASDAFGKDLRRFAAICRIVKGMKDVYVGAIGARTTAFKTVRYDEIAFQRSGINIETFDMSQIFAMMEGASVAEVGEKKRQYLGYADFSGVEAEKTDSIARFGVALDALISQYSLGAVAVRCWDELEKRYGIAPCTAMSFLNERGIPAACELDVNNAVMMRALSLAGGLPVGLFDVNNNYGNASDRAIFFHCSAIPSSMLSCKGCVGEHLMFKKAYGARSGVGILTGKVEKMHLTVGSLKTEDGRIGAFVTEGEVTDDRIEEAFFGTGFVFRKDDGNMGGLLNHMARNGYRHHVAFVPESCSDALVEAFSDYLGIGVERI